MLNNIATKQPSSPSQRFLFQFISSAAWFPVVISGCMSIYVVGASRQGLSWFSPKHNPYLCLQLFAGAAATGFSLFCLGNEKNSNRDSSSSSSTIAQILSKPPKPVILLAATCWSFYSALITRQRWHFKEWRYIVSAHLPLVALFGVYVSL